jgi:hypothetical protein
MKQVQLFQICLILVLICEACYYEEIPSEAIPSAINCEAVDAGFQTVVSPIIQNNCATAECHAGSQFPDFRNLQEIQQNAQRIRTQVVQRTMPPDRSLTPDEINAIACWVDNGTAVD